MSYTRKQLIEERRETAMPAGFTWPGGKRLGVLLGVCLEGWADGAWPGLGPMGNPLPAGAVACGSTCGGATAPAGAPLTASSARAVATTPTRVGAERAIIAQNPLSAQVNSPTK